MNQGPRAKKNMTTELKGILPFAAVTYCYVLYINREAAMLEGVVSRNNFMGLETQVLLY